MSEPLTKQEMFNRAYIGLASQGFKQCIDALGSCLYDDGLGHHCAWGWVDTSLGPLQRGGVDGLCSARIGVAQSLRGSDIDFARELQHCHDCSRYPASMKSRLLVLANKWWLTVPTLLGD